MEKILDFGGKRIRPDIRRLYDMKEVIYDKEFLENAENIELYYMYRGVFLDETDKKTMEENNLRYDITIIPPMKIGKEFVKTA
ncbi:glucose-6-phosphate isomerase, partial [archaeon]|nr:glucose-6-phosphate isomerase [archaeon]